MYIKLCNFGKPTDCALKAKQQPISDTPRKVRVYRIISLVLFAVCILLLIVILGLFVKLTGKQSCPTDTSLQECNLKKCQDIYQQSLFHESQCSCHHDCDKGWSKFENSCYFLSKERFSWHESRKDCQRRGGDLAMITNERLQRYLTTNGNMLYWIGLNQVSTNQWIWNNNTVLTVRYWGQMFSSGDCALLAANEEPERSWHQSICTLYLQYICQITRT
ncbi:killer cell lectin-like receptor subfamily E member 1 isoform X2 [Triplophysa dalaica]|uniref:killer cell lectin-like receptor subfamily E member 1 isoform X2 n=1 Tax=Triplophysa dalaica TaxID=1582913 RepID=UPI0024DFB745|nr:killer cell lectin-like receptor subfamily E member 1 isoform X2 [Triplophysa dalaica]